MSNNKKYNVLFIYTDTEFGGGGRFFGQVIRGLTPRGFRFVVACRQNAPIKNFYDKNGIKTIPFEVKNRFDIINMIKFCLGIKKYNFEIVCLGDATAWTTGIFISLFSDVKAIIPIVHGIHIGIGKKCSFLEKIVFKYWDRLWAHCANKIIVSSKRTLDLLVKEGVDSSKIEVIYNFPDNIDLEFNHSLIRKTTLEEYGINKEKRIIGILARLSYEKGIDIFIKSIPKITNSYSNCHFLIVGDGPERKNLEELVKNLSIENYVTFTGFIENPYKFLSAIDIVVLSSLFEGIPNIILESMAFGKTIVSSNCGSISEMIIDNKTGILIPPRNPEKLAEGIIKLFNDESLCKKLSKNAKIFVSEKLTKKRMWDRFEKLFLEYKKNY